MIRSFRSRALRAFWQTGEGRRLPVNRHERIRRQLLALDAASSPEQVDLPGFGFHGQRGIPKRWSIWVTGNFRLTFSWDGADAIDVDIEDYH